MFGKSEILILDVIMFILGIIAYQSCNTTTFAICACAMILVLIFSNSIRNTAGIIAFLFFILGTIYINSKTENFDTLQLIAPKYQVIVEGTLLTNPSSIKSKQTDFYFDVEKLIDKNKTFQN